MAFETPPVERQFPLSSVRCVYVVLWPSSLVHWTQALVLSECGFESRPARSRRLCPWAIHFTKTLNHNCFVPSDGTSNCRSRVLCNARKRTQDTSREREGACPGVSGFAPWAPSRVDMCALQIFCIIIIIIIMGGSRFQIRGALFQKSPNYFAPARLYEWTQDLLYLKQNCAFFP